MAVKKTSKKEVEVVETPTVEVDTEVVEETIEETIEEVVETKKENKVEVEVEPTVIDEALPTVTSSKGNVRIKMANRHHCFIGGVRYDLEAGQCYNVPINVKEILNRAGLLTPL